VLAGPAIFLIVGGVLKKTVIADELARRVVDPVYSDPAAHSAGEITLAFYAFAAQIYCDFSGYTDMAIGLALLLGYQLPQNFNRPYLALSLRDLWRRWHMTLSRFLRDYLYIPLGGSRKGTTATYRNLMITMLLGGLWHGAAWTFVLWGGLHGAVLALERWLESRREARGVERADTLGRRVLRRVVIFHVVCLGWVLFRSDSLSSAIGVLERLGSFGPVAAITPAVVILIIGGLGAQYLPSDLRLRLRRSFVSLQPVPMALALGGFLLVLDALGPEGVAPFIYFQF
jgi:D-alanyl-lipoteichoic acid acyltransferase DltB (MBOAT superfamily)